MGLATNQKKHPIQNSLWPGQCGHPIPHASSEKTIRTHKLHGQWLEVPFILCTSITSYLATELWGNLCGEWSCTRFISDTYPAYHTRISDVKSIPWADTEKDGKCGAQWYSYSAHHKDQGLQRNSLEWKCLLLFCLNIDDFISWTVDYGCSCV